MKRIRKVFALILCFALLLSAVCLPASAEELAALCAEVKGVGRVSVMITLKEGERTDYAGSKVSSVSPPSVLGAAIVCDGGGNAETRAELTRLVSGLLGIGSNRVTVAERRQ